MRTTRITASFQRQISDGNFGSETVRHEVELEAEDGEELNTEIARTALAACRRIVHEELAQSPNWQVRRAIEEPKPAVEAEQDQESLPF